MMQARFTAEDFKKQSADFRIGAVISDGMWYSLPKWRKISKVTEEEITQWIKKHLADGSLIQSETGAKSYRFPYESIIDWYKEHNLVVGEQLIDFLFPPRIWNGLTETEGFLNAPLREIGVVSFICAPVVAKEITEALRGRARVRETEPNHYKAYCLDSNNVKEIVEKVIKGHDEKNVGKIYSRAVAKRRELVDFPPDFSHGLVMFYKSFGKTLVKRTMDTISIFLPEYEDQETQIVMWVIESIEKFDESASVPFSGYLNSVLKRRPYDLPYTHLGKELSNFQRQRAKAIVALKNKTEGRTDFSRDEIGEEMDLDKHTFGGLEERHKVWLATRSATTLTWGENGEEKLSKSLVGGHGPSTAPTDIFLANRLSYALVRTALNTGNYEDAFSIISQVDVSDINLSRIREVSEDFVQQLGAELGIEGE